MADWNLPPTFVNTDAWSDTTANLYLDRDIRTIRRNMLTGGVYSGFASVSGVTQTVAQIRPRPVSEVTEAWRCNIWLWISAKLAGGGAVIIPHIKDYAASSILVSGESMLAGGTNGDGTAMYQGSITGTAGTDPGFAITMLSGSSGVSVNWALICTLGGQSV